jgi:hypothetical protein
MRSLHFLHLLTFAAIPVFATAASVMNLTPFKPNTEWEYQGTVLITDPYYRAKDKLTIRWDSTTLDAGYPWHYFTITDSLWDRFSAANADSSTASPLPDTVMRAKTTIWYQQGTTFNPSVLPYPVPGGMRHTYPYGFLPGYPLDTTNLDKWHRESSSTYPVWRWGRLTDPQIHWYADSIGMIHSVTNLDLRAECIPGYLHRTLHLEKFRGQGVDFGLDSVFAAAHPRPGFASQAAAKAGVTACSDIFNRLGHRRSIHNLKTARHWPWSVFRIDGRTTPGSPHAP